MRFSASRGVPSTRFVSPELGFVTSSESSHAPRPMPIARTAHQVSFRFMNAILEARGKRERIGAKRRVRRSVRLVDDAGIGLSTAGNARLWVVTSVVREGHQVAPDHANGPVAQPAHGAQLVAEAHFAELRVGAVFHVV